VTPRPNSSYSILRRINGRWQRSESVAQQRVQDVDFDLVKRPLPKNGMPKTLASIAKDPRFVFMVANCHKIDVLVTSKKMLNDFAARPRTSSKSLIRAQEL
jgi:hypothetical protein